MADSVLYAPTDMIYIVCKQSVYIRQLRMSGPIVAPLKVRMATAFSIVQSGVKLYQYNPVTQEYALMTIKNAFRKDKFPSYSASTASTETTSYAATSVTLSEETGTAAKESVKDTATSKVAKVDPEEAAEAVANLEEPAEETVQATETTETVVEETKTEETQTKSARKKPKNS